MTDDSKKINVPTYLKFSKVLTYLIYSWIMFGVVMLCFRIFLLATSANPSTGFVDFVYRTSSDFMQPFRGMFPGKEVGETGYFDTSAVFAIIIYLIIAWLISAVIKYVQLKINEINDAEAERLERIKQKEQDAEKARQGLYVEKTSYTHSSPRQSVSTTTVTKRTTKPTPKI